MAGKKESALDLSKFVDKGVRVKLAGGREGESAGPGPRLRCGRARFNRRQQSAGPTPPRLACRSPAAPKHTLPRLARPRPAALKPPVSGILKGYDQLLNVVLDDAVEYLRGARSTPRCTGMRARARARVFCAGVCNS